jgi:hydroxypyruvate reductase
MGDQIDLIGSGPTAPDPTTFADALNVVEKYKLENDLPTSVLSRLNFGFNGELSETPKPYNPIFDKTDHIILANNQTALQASLLQAVIEGYTCEPDPVPMKGEASQVGKDLAQQLIEMTRTNYPLKRPTCLIAGGETTVTLRNTADPGRGGRNLELALSALPLLDGLSNVALITLATDGEDGNTYAAGAVVTGESFQRCQELGLDPKEYLSRHDSYTLFKALDDLLVTGPTGTNVNDLCFLFAF